MVLEYLSVLDSRMKFSKYCCCLVAKSCTALCNLLDWIFQARILEWVAISFSKGSSRPSDRTRVSCIAGRFFTAEPPGKPQIEGCSCLNTVYGALFFPIYFCCFCFALAGPLSLWDLSFLMRDRTQASSSGGSEF